MTTQETTVPNPPAPPPLKRIDGDDVPPQGVWPQPTSEETPK